MNGSVPENAKSEEQPFLPDFGPEMHPIDAIFGVFPAFSPDNSAPNQALYRGIDLKGRVLD